MTKPRQSGETNKQKKIAIVIDVEIPSDSSISKKEHEKVKKYQVLR